MSRGQQTFRQSDVTKALKAAVKAGIAVERLEIDKDGKTVIVAIAARCSAPINEHRVHASAFWCSSPSG
jgi:hypothetical protein